MAFTMNCVCFRFGKRPLRPERGIFMESDTSFRPEAASHDPRSPSSRWLALRDTMATILDWICTMICAVLECALFACLVIVFGSEAQQLLGSRPLLVRPVAHTRETFRRRSDTA